ncbi:hypothetical protein BH11MYX3_BH11MYX3_29780 [soil metagenome]
MRALVIVALLASVAHADVSGVYGVGFSADFGNTYLPPTAHAGLSTTLSYREYHGKIGNWIIFLSEAPAPPSGSSKTETSEPICGGGYCTVYETTTYTPPSAEAVRQWESNMSEFSATKGKAILAGQMGQELTIDVTMRSLGGDASGFMLKLMRPLPGSNGLVMIGQYALGWLTYHDVKSRKVVATNGVLSSVEVTGDHTFTYVGLPIRVQVPIGGAFGAHLQFDNNIYGWLLGDASPIRAGASWIGPHTIVQVEGVISGFRPDGGSLNGSVSVAF